MHKILIVDDEFNNRKLLQQILQPYGHCDMVVNGVEAVEIFEMAMDEGAPYTLICLDIMMPEMDGQEALKRIRASEKVRQVPPSKETTILMITALDTPKDVIEAFYQGGCSDYLVKPVTGSKLVNKLTECGVLSKR
ncbi:MAG: response regulator [Magnetococcales bacterium]|nr:response regulator [Magnetococcales bacterium]NGZ26511.1 response regulator [Magnetococcales bacterium]